LTRHAYVLARSGKYDDASAIIEAIRSHEHFQPAWHESATFKSSLNAICAEARKRARATLRSEHEKLGPDEP
jgi:hypothetical protein